MCWGEAGERLAKLEGAIIFPRKGSAIIQTLPDMAACISHFLVWNLQRGLWSAAPRNLLSHSRRSVCKTNGEKVYDRSGSFCLYARLKNNTGALDFFFFSDTFLVFPQTRVPSMWVWL